MTPAKREGRNQAMRAAYAAGSSVRKVAAEFGVSPTQVHTILTAAEPVARVAENPTQATTRVTPRPPAPRFRCSWCHDAVLTSEADAHGRACKLDRDRRGHAEARDQQEQTADELIARRTSGPLMLERKLPQW